jgi:hypothetical protein
MPAALATDARDELATLLATVTGYKVHKVAPNAPIPPCLVIVPDTPWIVPERIGTVLNYRLRLKVLVVVDSRNNAAALVKMENAVEAVAVAIGDTFIIDQISPPQITDTGSSAVLVSEVSTTSHIIDA